MAIDQVRQLGDAFSFAEFQEVDETGFAHECLMFSETPFDDYGGYLFLVGNEVLELCAHRTDSFLLFIRRKRIIGIDILFG